MSLRRVSRALTRLFLLIVVPLAAIAVGAYVYLTGGRYVTTENAYVKNDIVQVSADIEGRVVDVAVRDHEQVRTGDLLFRIDPVPVEIRLARAEAETNACDLFIAVGSSLVVYPAAGFPARAKRRGARLVILNREPTDLDPIADLVLHREIGPTLSGVTGP